VDLLLFHINPRNRFFDHVEASLASQALTSLEIDMTPLILAQRVLKTRILARLRQEVETARKYDVPIVISSGASSEYLLRTPHDYVATITLFDMPSQLGLKGVSDNPRLLVERNREKLTSDFLTPGVRVVKRSNT
jgi:ribonuclease P/MRP protein subunit RPP1